MLHTYSVGTVCATYSVGTVCATYSVGTVCATYSVGTVHLQSFHVLYEECKVQQNKLSHYTLHSGISSLPLLSPPPTIEWASMGTEDVVRFSFQ